MYRFLYRCMFSVLPDRNPRIELRGQPATLFKPEQLQNQSQSLPVAAPWLPPGGHWFYRAVTVRRLKEGTFDGKIGLRFIEHNIRIQFFSILKFLVSRKYTLNQTKKIDHPQSTREMAWTQRVHCGFLASIWVIPWVRKGSFSEL